MSAKTAICPLCAKPSEEKFAPFCSAGCKDRDLLKWLGEGYSVSEPIASSDQLMDHFEDEA